MPKLRHREGTFVMIIIKVMGGLGNQMQQYALYEKFRSLGKDACLDISWFEDASQQENVLAKRKLELRFFDNLQFETCTEKQRRDMLGSQGIVGKVMRKLNPASNKKFSENSMYHPEIFELQDAYLEGFWACEKYYADILKILREKICFPKIRNIQNSLNVLEKQKYQKNILNIETQNKMKSENSVSIHIRRGDYLDPENAGMFGGICTDLYYEAAENYIRERVENPHFYLFSDDPDYLRRKYQGEEYTVVDWNTGEDSFYDMQLMSCCRHNICANSTFSFWGARLNPNEEKIMIRPAKHKNSQVIDPAVMHELWEQWVLVDGDGRVI